MQEKKLRQEYNPKLAYQETLTKEQTKEYSIFSIN